jgi:hypothetical protein
MLYEDKYGRIFSEEDVDQMSFVEIEEREVHVFQKDFADAY